MKNVSTSGRAKNARKAKFLAVLAASSILAGWGSQAAFASESRIDKLQAEIDALRSEIHHLRRHGGPIYVTKGEPLPAGPGPHVIETSKYGVHFGFADADNQNTVELTGRLHIDTGGYAGIHQVTRGNGFLTHGLASGINFRRARIGVQGIFLGDWAYGLIFDLGGSSDGYNGGVGQNSGTSTSGIENAFITYNGLYKHGGPFPVAFDIGAIDVP